MTTTATAPAIFGVSVDPLTLRTAVDRCESAIDARRPLQVGVINAAKVVNMRKDRELRDSVRACDLVLADGQSVVWASRLLRRPLPERVTGIDLFEALLAAGAAKGRSVYLLGATQEVLDRVRAVITDRHPGLMIAGAHHGYYGPEQEQAIADGIAESGADMLFIAMGSPQKERFVAKHGPTMGVPLVHGVGGSFDVLAGLTRRAPARWQRSGFEWLYRLLQEPGRMWKRYLRTNTVFIAMVGLELLRSSTIHRPATALTTEQETSR